MGSKRSDFGDGASPGKIFIGGLAKDATLDTFVKYFGKYGKITDSVIMKDRHTGRPWVFGFITYADPAVVDTVIAETHVINGKQVEIKRTIPKGSGDSKDFKTKKIFVGGISTSVSEDEFQSFFSKYGKVVEHEIIRDHMTTRSCGFGFIMYDSEQVFDSILADGNMIDMNGCQVEVKKAEPKKPSNPAPAYASDYTSYADSYGGFGSSYSSVGGAGFGPASYRSIGSGMGGRFSGYGYGGVSEYAGRYGDYGNSEFGYRGNGPLGYTGRFGSYGTGFGGGGGYGGGPGDYGRGGGGGGGRGYGGYGVGYEFGPGSGGGGGGGMYGGSRAGYSGSSRYHPYAR